MVNDKARRPHRLHALLVHSERLILECRSVCFRGTQMRRKMRSFGLAAAAVLAAAAASAFDNEPKEFRGVPWGAPIAKFAGEMIAIENDGAHIYYKRKGDKMIIGGARLRDVVYEFYKGSFEGVMILSQPGSNPAMLAAFNAQFGQGEKASGFVNRYLWQGTTAVVFLDCNDIASICTAAVQSTAVNNQIERDEKAEAAGAKKDF